MTDIDLLVKLAARMSGRVPRRIRDARLRRLGLAVFRDPARVALRYLRRFAGGQWHRGGYHVARPGFGPGIAFACWENPARRGHSRAWTINCAAQAA